MSTKDNHCGYTLVLRLHTVDYNSWQESDKGLRLAAGLDKDVVLAEGVYPDILCPLSISPISD